LSISFYGFIKEETQHMKEVTIENGGTPINDVNDPQCTHIVINDQVIKQLPNLGTSTTTTDQWNNSDIESSSNSVLIASGSVTPTSKSSNNPAALFINMNMSPFSNTRASIVRAEWFWASIQICCRASECLYEFTKPKSETGNGVSVTKLNFQDPPTKRIKLSVDNLLSNEVLNSTVLQNTNSVNSNLNSPHHVSSSSQRVSGQFCLNNNNNSKTPTQLLQSETNSANQTLSAKKNSSDNLLAHVLTTTTTSTTTTTTITECDSPALINASSTNNRLSRNRNNMSNNNLSTSASLLDATTDDAMSSDNFFFYLFP